MLLEILESKDTIHAGLMPAMKTELAQPHDNQAPTLT